MRAIAFPSACVAASIAFAGVSWAQDDLRNLRILECRPLDRILTPIEIECRYRIVDDVIEYDDDCVCPANFVLIDPTVVPASGPDPDPASDG
jgi:hypothetical protein